MRRIIVICLFSSSFAHAKPKIAVMPLGGVNIEEHVSKILSDILTVEVDKLGTHDVISESEINTLLGMERLKDTLGCDDAACAADIGGALGADQMIAGSVGRLGSTINIKVTLFDVGGMKVEKRVLEEVEDDEDLYKGAIVHAVSRLFGEVEEEVTPHADADKERFFVFASGGEVLQLDLEGGGNQVGPVSAEVGAAMRMWGPLRGSLSYLIGIESLPGEGHWQSVSADLHFDLAFLYLVGAIRMLVDPTFDIGLLGGVGKAFGLGNGFYIDAEINGVVWPQEQELHFGARLGVRWGFALVF